MKKIILIILLIGFTTSTFAKEKKSPTEKRAKANTEFIATEMGLNASDKTFVYDALLARYNFNAKKIKGKDLSSEAKKAVYQEAHKNFQVELAKEFSKKEIKQINDLIKTINQKAKKK